MSPPEVGVGRIPDRVIEEIRERADFVSVVARSVTLKKSGSRFWGLCPFHSEKTPSFQVHPERGIFYCFGCGEGGDVFAFRMRQEGLGFLDAARSLAQEFGVPIPRTDGGTESRSTPLYAANDLALGYFRRILRSSQGAGARAYLERRGVPQDLVDRFQLGFAPPSWDGLLGELRERRASLRHAEEAGLIAARQTGDGHYDRFRGRVMFPIAEPGGRVVAFGGRALGDETPKYLNSSESPIYRKGRALFGLSLAVDAIRKQGRAVLAEGYFDVIALHRAGVTEAVAPCGTALTADHAGRLRRYAKEVVLLFDGDEAGQRASERALTQLAGAGLRVRATFLASDDDPDTLLAREGEPALRECVEGAMPLIEELIDRRLGMRRLSEWEASDIAQSFGPLLQAVPDPIEREAYEKRIAARLELTPQTVAAALGASRRRPVEPESPARVSAPRIDPLVRVLIGALAACPELVSLVDDLAADRIPDGVSGTVLGHVLAALRERGADGIADLLSPANEALAAELKPVLSQAVVEADPGDKAAAERAVRDCVARLGIRALDSESGALGAQLESCTNPGELERLLRRKQQLIEERSQLWSRLREQ